MTLNVTKEVEIPALETEEKSGPALLSGAQILPYLSSVKVHLIAQLGTTEMTVQELTDLRQGSTVKLDRLVDQPIDLMVEGHVAAQGTLVAVGDHFGIRITTPPKMS